jgi:hypothetical protein
MSAAGPFFTDGRHALAGYQPSKSCITGIGGKAEAGEIPILTAMREFVEEIFCCEAPDLLVAQLAIAVRPRGRLQNSGYELIVYDFADLERLLEVCAAAELETPAYSRPPRTLMELILWRQAPAEAEVQALALIPLGCDVAAEFVADGLLVRAAITNIHT